MTQRYDGGTRLLIRLFGFGVGLYLLYRKLSARDWLDAVAVGGLLLLWTLEIVSRRGKKR